MTSPPGQKEIMLELVESIKHDVEAISQESETGFIGKRAERISASCARLCSLVSNPVILVNRLAMSYTISVAISLALDMDLPTHIALEDPTPMENLVEATGCSKKLLKLIMSQLTFNGIFEEVTCGKYRQNSSSLAFKNKQLASWFKLLVDDGLRASGHMCDYLAANQFQIPDSPQNSAFSRAFGTDKTFYEYIRDVDKKRGERFDTALEATAADTSLEMAFPFQSLTGSATVVDVGGGRGHHSLRLAKLYPSLNFIIQDHKDALEDPDSKITVSRASSDKIKWQAHDFFCLQPVKGADVYLLNNVLMDHPDSACRRILRCIVDAMAPNHSTCLVSDGFHGDEMPPLTASHQLYMLSFLGCVNRTLDEWRALFSDMDEKLSVEKLFSSDTGRVIFALRKRE